MVDKNEIKKDLYKSKEMANFSHYVSGNLYYTVKLIDGIYQFPIKTVEDDETSTNEQKSIVLSSDLGVTSFNSEMRGSELIRWIQKAIDSGDFVKIG